jgi:hypothetical protein
MTTCKMTRVILSILSPHCFHIVTILLIYTITDIHMCLKLLHLTMLSPCDVSRSWLARMSSWSYCKGMAFGCIHNIMLIPFDHNHCLIFITINGYLNWWWNLLWCIMGTFDKIWNESNEYQISKSIFKTM